MNSLNLETKMANLHQELSTHESIQGSLLIKDNGLHISSNVDLDNQEKRKLAANIAHIFRYFYNLCQVEELDFKWRGLYLYLKHIPAKNLILTTIGTRADIPNLKELTNHYSQAFLNIFQKMSK